MGVDIASSGDRAAGVAAGQPSADRAAPRATAAGPPGSGGDPRHSRRCADRGGGRLPRSGERALRAHSGVPGVARHVLRPGVPALPVHRRLNNLARPHTHDEAPPCMRWRGLARSRRAKRPIARSQALARPASVLQETSPSAPVARSSCNSGCPVSRELRLLSLAEPGSPRAPRTPVGRRFPVTQVALRFRVLRLPFVP
jgi:hypothetical protein